MHSQINQWLMFIDLPIIAYKAQLIDLPIIAYKAQLIDLPIIAYKAQLPILYGICVNLNWHQWKNARVPPASTIVGS